MQGIAMKNHAGHSDFSERLVRLVCEDKAAADAFDGYYSTAGRGFTGSQFEHLTDRSHPNEITAKDLVAVSMLSVNIPAAPARWLLSDEGRTEVHNLLSEVPENVSIWQPEAIPLLASDGPLWRLWVLLGSAAWPRPREGNGLGGRTRRSKLLHAKRPHLVPIWDSVVERLLPPTHSYWQAFRSALADDDRRAQLADATKAAPAHLPLLRRIDIVLWWAGTQGGATVPVEQAQEA